MEREMLMTKPHNLTYNNNCKFSTDTCTNYCSSILNMLSYVTVTLTSVFIQYTHVRPDCVLFIVP